MRISLVKKIMADGEESENCYREQQQLAGAEEARLQHAKLMQRPTSERLTQGPPWAKATRTGVSYFSPEMSLTGAQ